MKQRVWEISLFHFDPDATNQHCNGETFTLGRKSFSPTVRNVEAAIAEFAPAFVPKDDGMTVSEQIEDGLWCGYFSILLDHTEGQREFEVYSIGFLEI